MKVYRNVKVREIKEDLVTSARDRIMGALSKCRSKDVVIRTLRIVKTTGLISSLRFNQRQRKKVSILMKSRN